MYAKPVAIFVPKYVVRRNSREQGGAGSWVVKLSKVISESIWHSKR
jgi:hypothetical protein